MAKPVTQSKAAVAAAPAEAPLAPKQRRLIVPVIVALLGIAAGGVGASAYFLFLHPKTAEAGQMNTPPLQGAAMDDVGEDTTKPPPAFIKLDRMTLPMVTKDGHLVAYMSVETVLQARTADVEYIKLRVPLMRHAFNESFNSNSVVDATDTHKVDFIRAGALLRAAANKALGNSMIEQAEVITALPL